jgi:linoleoyl-CoA desaturase
MSKNTIKFSSDSHQEFVKELRQQIKSYFDDNSISKFGNYSLLSKSIFMSLVYFLPFLAILGGLVSSSFGIILAWLIMGFGMAGVGMVLMHDANHGAFSKHKWVNHLLSKSMYFLGGFPTNWRYQHNTLHHRFTNVDGHDEDISPVGILRFSPHKPALKIHRFQHIYAWFFYGLMTISWVIYRDFVQLSRYSKENKKAYSKERTSYLLINLIIAKIIYFGVFLALPILLHPASWSAILVGFFVMHFVCGLVLGVIFQTAHVMTSTEFPLANTEGEIENNWTVHQLLTTTNYSPKSKWFSWLIGGLNYQVEHHLFPQISHVHYSKISNLVRSTAAKYNVPYFVEPSFWVALKQHYIMLKSLGKPA